MKTYTATYSVKAAQFTVDELGQPILPKVTDSENKDVVNASQEPYGPPLKELRGQRATKWCAVVNGTGEKIYEGDYLVNDGNSIFVLDRDSMVRMYTKTEE